MAEIEQNKSNLFAYDIYIQDTYTGLFGKGIEYNSVFEFQYEATSEVTNEPVEEGGFASFYKTMQPEKITLVFGFNTVFGVFVYISLFCILFGIAKGLMVMIDYHRAHNQMQE